MDQASIHSDPSGLIKDKFNQVLMRTFKLDDLEMIKTIGTGTFARVFLCRPRAHLNRSNTDYYALKVRRILSVNIPIFEFFLAKNAFFCYFYA